MSRTYADDRAFSDLFLDRVCEITGPKLWRRGTFEADTKQATDLAVLDADGIRMGVRIRTHKYLDRYPFEFTIRSGRDSGARTEASKIFEGWGDWFFYGFAGRAAPEIARWWLISLAAFRSQLALNRRIRRVHKSNRDGTHLIAFDVRDFDSSLVIAASHPPAARGDW